jgi:glycosyltransferase involved in cell wall biosynthesis
MLAIVVPYYKVTFFEETLYSLVSQTDKRFNVYIGNDGSNENPEAIIEKYSGSINLKYVAYKDNLGKDSLVNHWNRCMKMIESEEWLMILGDDDVLESNVVELFYESIDDVERISSVIRFATYKINNLGIKVSKECVHPKIEKSSVFIFRNVRSSLSEYIFRTSKVKEIGFKNFPLAWYSDLLAVLEFSNFNEVFSINEAFVQIRISELSISGNNTNYDVKSKARFEFYYYLLSKKRNKFSPEQINELFGRLNTSYLNEKKNIIYFYKIAILYYSNKKFKQYFSFLCLIIGSLFKVK